MNLTGQLIRHVNTITHDSKVLVVGTAADGALYYSVKRSGFEDSALVPGATPFGFEPWKPLRLGESLEDPSVIADEQDRLTDPDGTVLVRSVYGDGAEVTRSADAPVQLVSLAGHVYVFRQSPGGKLLVNRFVLDGMLNQLVPKLEVRFRRSKQRLEPLEPMDGGDETVVDSLDYRDIDGNPFYEPALELGCVGTIASGGFSAACVATSESDRGRWHIVTGDAAAGLVLHSIGSTSSLPFDVGDHLYAQVDPDGEHTTYRSIPGITRRTVALEGFTLAGRPSATLYDLQTEQLTDTGPQLLRGATRLMLAVPVRAQGDEAARTAALSLGIAADGTLSRIDPSPDAIELLCSDAQEVLLPLTLLDSIREVATTEPPPAGTIAGIGRGDEDRLAIRSQGALPADLAAGQDVELRGTQSYDGHYVVQAVDGATFQVEAVFERGEPGFWEVIPENQTGLVFDNMIVGYGKTAEGKLQISCSAHDLQVGDEVQISGTRTYDGTYPVIAVDAGATSFTLDAPFFTGEAANLSVVTRRGLRLDGDDDHLETPSLGHAAPSRTAALGRTLSAWLHLDVGGTAEQQIVAEAAGLIALAVGADQKLEVQIRMSDGTIHTARDPAALATGAWVHVAGTLAYDPSTGGDTRIALCRDEAEIAQQTIPHAAPCHLRETVLDLSGGGAYCDVAGGDALFAGRFTVACWANVTGGANGVRAAITCRGSGFTGFHCRADAQNHWEIVIGDGAQWVTVLGPAVAQNTWTHLAATWDGATLALYVDGVAAKIHPTPFSAPTGAPLRLGAGLTGNTPGEHFLGQLADVRVWSRALAADEIAARRAVPPDAHETSLTGYWPLDDGTANDRSLAKRHGAIMGTVAWPDAVFLVPEGDPAESAAAASYSIGRGLRGELADVQVWDLARSVDEIADTRYLQLTGAEHGLAASYRLGAIVYEEPPIVPDFSIHSHDAVVYGDPYAGARRLDRATDSGMKVVAYSSDEVIAVTQRATYEESFEFFVTSPDPAFEPGNADGTGRPLFEFSYWGKASQTSPERIAVSPGSYQQVDFALLDDGWYRASCRVTVPDGVPLLRAFEISNVRGTWGSEPAPPANEWTAIDIRKHRLRMISDVVTREGYTDRPALAALPAQAQAMLDELEVVRHAEADVARIEATIADLEARLEVAENNERYVHERDTLQNTTLPNLQDQRAEAQAERDAIVNDEYSYYQEFQVVHTGMWLTTNDNHVVYQAGQHTLPEWQRWKITRIDDGYCTIAHQQTRKFLEVPHGGGSNTQLKVYDVATEAHQQWKLVPISGTEYYYLSARHNGLVADVRGEETWSGAEVVAYDQNGKNNQRWDPTTTTVMTDTATSALAAKDAELAQLDAQIAATQERIDWLNAALATQEDPDVLRSQITAAQTELAAARTALGTADQEFLAALVRPDAAVMPVLETDDRGLVTTGAVLDFVQPIGSVSAVESCEGTVQLAYVDRAGRIRLTCYDATADSLNTEFEQWLPDAARACVDVRDGGDHIALAAPVTLPSSGSTCEAWLRWPAATQDTGTVYGANAVVGGAAAADVPLMIRDGNRLGLRVDGWYFDAGIELSRVLATGWHHVAASTRGIETGFFVDGVKVASRRTEQPALRFDGAASYLEVPAYDSPTAAVTVSVWARSAGATWNDTSHLVSKRDAFLMYPLKGSTGMRFYVFTLTGSWQSVEYTIADIQAWHHYTGTYDGYYLRLYVDGIVVVERSVTGTIKADAGPMYIGKDDGSHVVPFAGDIAEVAVWSTARTLEEVSADLYRSPTGSEPGLVGCWRMERIEDAGEIKIADVSPNGRHALLRGEPMDALPTTQRDRQVSVLGNVAGGGSPIGRFSEVRLWSAPLSDDEIAMNARVVLTGREPGLLAYWPLDEGAGATARDRAAGGTMDGSIAGADWAGCTANLGNLGGAVLGLPDRGGAYVTCPTVAIASTSFTVELWARRSGANQTVTQYMVAMGTKTTNQGLHIGFRNTNTFTFAFWTNDVDTVDVYTDTDWHHWSCMYDQPTRAQRIYRDGVKVTERTATGDFIGTGELQIGRGLSNEYFLGELSDVRIWNRARTEAELRADFRLRLTGTEDGLIAYYPLDAAHAGSGQVRDKVNGEIGTLHGTARVLLTTGLPAAGASDLVATEYSTVGATADGAQQAVMRRCVAYASGGQVGLGAELRIEELLLQWIGNTQIAPTLVGYIEGAPPVPSENLTVGDDYRGAATVSLMQAVDTVYTFQRVATQGQSLEQSGYLGAGWYLEDAGRFLDKGLTEGDLGTGWNYLYDEMELNRSTTESSSTYATTDRLTLSGRVEDKAMNVAVGPRFVPKNVGYALVVSGTADVFVTKLVRSGRMVGYDVRPVEGVPLDVNTITFLMNPAYSLNGTLDGLVGSMPADPTFYPHVPSMRAQYGSKYPASYFRMEEAYALAERIVRMDRERESYFYNFDAENLGSFTPAAASRTGEPDAEEDDDPETARDRLFQEAKQRQEDIEASYLHLEDRVRASQAFAQWQVQMTKIQTHAGKRNVVNTYIWDGDGGLRAKEQSFANTVEHSLGVATSHSGWLGEMFDLAFSWFRGELSLIGSLSKADAGGKMLSQGRTLQLAIDLSGIEQRGITDLRDNPLVPGEKVDRYRFMSYYLEGSTDHFHDFFAQVVDPEWLISNDEEARALRQTQAGKPNRCWRVLHRVTYVERPALMNLGQEAGTVQGTTEGAPTLEDRLTALEEQVAEQGEKLDEILRLLTEMAPPSRSR